MVLFDVESDFGDKIIGYLVTDSLSGSGRVEVTSKGNPVAVVEATRLIPEFAAAGRHETGHCGFLIDDSQVPGLNAITDLEIRETESSLLIYRRARESTFLPDKVVRLETHMVPPRRIDQMVRPYFCYAYLGAEQAGLESVTQIFNLRNVKSLYLSGRVFYRSFEHLLERDCKTIIVLHDPFEELAERLLFFRHAARRNRLNARDQLTFASALEFAVSLPLSDDRKMRSTFGHITQEAAFALQNPVVRQLTANNVQEMPRVGALASALTVLASCAVVGLRRESETFAAAIAAVLTIEQESLPVIPRCTAAMLLADKLKDIPRAYDLLELDLELYDRISEAHRKAATGLSIT